MPVTKLSILFFYLRIFPGDILRRVTWGLIIVCALTAITFVLVDSLQCSPVEHYWKQWDGQPGRCISPSGPAWSISAIGIIIDFLMLSLPLHQIRQLSLPWWKKVTVGLMFGVGFLYVFQLSSSSQCKSTHQNINLHHIYSVTIVSILRLQSLVHFRNTTNPTCITQPCANRFRRRTHADKN
jgi:hypothetical protein